MSKQWKCGVVGTGMVGATHVKVLPLIPSAKLVAVCDAKRENAQAALRKAEISGGVPIYQDLGQMLRNEELDVIHIGMPSGAHLEPALAAIEAGKHVITEKPLEIALDRADRIIEAARQKNVRVACIFQNRWKPENRAIREAAEQGRFGKLAWAGCFTPWYRPDKYYDDVPWRGTWKLDGGGAIMNQSIHSIDLLQWIAGPVRRVSAYNGSRIHPKIETEDTLSGSLQFASGAFGSVMGTTAMFPGQPARIEIGGENGTAISENGLKLFSFRESRPQDQQLLEELRPGAGGNGKSNPAAIGYEPHRRNIESILDAWTRGVDAETCGPEARKSLAIVIAMYESARNDGAPVDVRMPQSTSS
jgi:UDP-N-acetyl-2-amino-2-deoxyglucuronate dehydrogenase